MSNKKPYIIPGRIGYRMTFNESNHQIEFEDTNENNLAAAMIYEGQTDKLISTLEDLKKSNPKQRKELSDEINLLRKMKLKNKDFMAHVMSYIIETKTPEDYEVKKSKLIDPSEEDKKK